MAVGEYTLRGQFALIQGQEEVVETSLTIN